jgi:hypothetical protein
MACRSKVLQKFDREVLVELEPHAGLRGRRLAGKMSRRRRHRLRRARGGRQPLHLSAPSGRGGRRAPGLPETVP